MLKVPVLIFSKMKRTVEYPEFEGTHKALFALDKCLWLPQALVLANYSLVSKLLRGHIP